jgi:hypothetical protein
VFAGTDVYMAAQDTMNQINRNDPQGWAVMPTGADKSGAAPKPEPAASPGTLDGEPTKVSPTEQKARDSDARKILTKELATTETKLQKLTPGTDEYVRKVSDIEAIKREISKL